MIKIDFLEYKHLLKTKKEDGKRYLFDPIRKKYLIITPEELVRQLVISYFLIEKSYNKNRIAIEKSLRVNGLLRRWDILVYDKNMNPWLLVECKAPEVKISQATFEQIARYNLTLNVPYLLVTNGLNSFCCEINYDNQSFEFLTEIPSPKVDLDN